MIFKSPFQPKPFCKSMCCPNREHHREPCKSQTACPTQLACSHPDTGHWTWSTWQQRGWDGHVGAVSLSASCSVSGEPGTRQVELYLAKAKQRPRPRESDLRSPSPAGTGPSKGHTKC